VVGLTKKTHFERPMLFFAGFHLLHLVGGCWMRLGFACFHQNHHVVRKHIFNSKWYFPTRQRAKKPLSKILIAVS